MKIIKKEEDASIQPNKEWGFIIFLFVIIGIISLFSKPDNSKKSLDVQKELLSYSYVEGRPTRISSIFGYRYMDVLLNCKMKNCESERFYFKKDKNGEELQIRVLNYIVQGYPNMLISYEDGFFKRVKSVS